MTFRRTPLETLIIAAAVLLGAPAALAGVDEPNNAVMRQCTVLTDQFDQAQSAHKTDKNYKEAVSLDAEGKSLCSSSGMEGAGVAHLRSAMKLIGVKPSM